MIEIPADECKIEVWPIPGIHSRGGQHAGINTSVRVTHLPTGIAAFVGTDRSQHINKMIAMDMIMAAITHPKFR